METFLTTYVCLRCLKAVLDRHPNSVIHLIMENNIMLLKFDLSARMIEITPITTQDVKRFIKNKPTMVYFTNNHNRTHPEPKYLNMKFLMAMISKMQWDIKVGIVIHEATTELNSADISMDKPIIYQPITPYSRSFDDQTIALKYPEQMKEDGRMSRARFDIVKNSEGITNIIVDIYDPSIIADDFQRSAFIKLLNERGIYQISSSDSSSSSSS